VRVNDLVINDTTTLLNTIAQLKPGSVVKLALERKRKKIVVQVVIGKRPMRLPKNLAG
jgi:serine protease DegQ